MREGWVCPKCGAPNNPDNQTCVACFSTADDPAPPQVPPIWEPMRQPHTLPKPNCPKCGGPGYPLCPDYNCPMRSAISYTPTCSYDGGDAN